MTAEDHQHAQRPVDQQARIEEHADRDEEEDREGVAQRQRLLGGAMTQRGLAQHHAGEERAQRERHAEELGRAVGDADGRRDHAQREELARSGARHLPQQPGKETASHHQHQRHEQRRPVPSVSARVRPRSPAATARVAAQPGREGRQQDEHEDHGQVLDHQPTHGDASIERLDQAPPLEGAQQHDGARDRERQAEHEPGAEAPSPGSRQQDAERGRDRDLHQRARERDAS